jgi:hypothetical protein
LTKRFNTGVHRLMWLLSSLIPKKQNTSKPQKTELRMEATEFKI